MGGRPPLDLAPRELDCPHPAVVDRPPPLCPPPRLPARFCHAEDHFNKLCRAPERPLLQRLTGLPSPHPLPPAPPCRFRHAVDHSKELWRVPELPRPAPAEDDFGGLGPGLTDL